MEETKITDKNNNEVIVKDIDMPFWSMVGFMIKWAIASIPAFIILVLIFSILSAFLTGLAT